MNKLVGSRTVVSLLAFMLLPALWSVDARGGETRITTEQVNEAIQQMQRLAEKEIAQAAVPGLAIAVVFQNQVVYAAGFGVRDVNTREPVNADTVFQLASLSKPIGSTVVAELIGEGKISGRLAIVEGPHKLSFPLKHYDRDTFTCKSEGENAVLAAGVIFTVGADWKAATVTVENLNVRGEGIFKHISAVEGTAKATPSDTATGEFARLVDIGNGRKMYLKCSGAGSPTVIFESGYRNDADIWSAQIEPGNLTVFPEVAKFTHVCAYDRPGTLLDADHLGRSDPVEMPRTAQDLVSDLHLLLQKAHIPGPYVLVAHSFGGIFARLYASTYPDEVIGMVLVDALSENVRSGLTPEQWKLYANFGFKEPPPGLEKYKEIETLDVDTSFDQMEKAKTARPLRQIPLVVLTQGQPFDLSPWQPLPADFPAALDKAWHAAQDAQATLVSGSKHIIATKSSHYIQIQQPKLVIDAIRDVVNAVREPASW